MSLMLERLPIQLAVDGYTLDADLEIPEAARGLVLLPVLAPGGRRTDRIAFLAAELERGGFATLRCDLLTPEEGRMDARSAQFRFDPEFLARRIAVIARWAGERTETSRFAIGCVASGSAAAAALLVAAETSDVLSAVVTMGGRSALPGDALRQVAAPTLLLVGEFDEFFITTNREAYKLLDCEKQLRLIPGAAHLIDEPGAIEEAAKLSVEWMRAHLGVAALSC